ncbi:MAG TPA: ABC transporter permease [Candidatus Acidoferrum sp.]|nr:ABC transporter permease [Candidatus Acidoferrum sp.]
MTDLMQDVRYAVRMLLKAPGFAAIAILTLALGIGANTALFSVVNGILLNPLPYPQPKQLVAVAEKYAPFPEASIAYPNFLDWVRMNHTFQGLAAYRGTDFNMTGMGKAERLKGIETSSDFFQLLGVEPVIGRNFSKQDDKQGAAPVVMLSARFWKNKFAGAPNVLGRELDLDGTGYTIVGVVPANFYFCCASMNFELGDVYVPIGAAKETWITMRDSHPGIRAIGRMKPGVSVEQARADMSDVAASLARAYPDTNKNAGVLLTPLQQRMVQGIQSTLFVLLAAVGFVLLIACVNVANLLLARSGARAREIAIRAALGASRGRVIRQLLTESVILGLCGGALGLLLAAWGTAGALSIVPGTLPRANDVRIDPRVLLFTLVVSLLAGILFGLAPALKTAHPDLHEELKEGGRGASGARYRTQGIFVVVEMALAVVLLVGAGLTIRSLARLWSVNRGYDARNVLTFSLAFPPSTVHATPDELRTVLRQLPEKIAQIPGVQAASVTDASAPLTDDWEQGFYVAGRPKPPRENELPETLLYIVSPDYLRAMGIPLLRGRFFAPEDSPHSQRVGVIDEDFAQEYFPNQDAVGQTINLDAGPGKFSPVKIIGVAGHIEEWGVDSGFGKPVRVELYTLAEQVPDELARAINEGAGIVVRTEAPNYPRVDAIRSALQQMNSEEAPYEFHSMDEIISKSLDARRFAMILLAVFAGLALLLSSIGIYGVISYVVGQRTHEIGIRMALGAQRRDVLKIVMGHAALLAAIGVAIGLAAGAGLTQLMSKILYGVSATDPLTFAVVAVVLTAVALAACYIPARRAMAVDPMVALRYE